jgi:hypothetical protein
VGAHWPNIRRYLSQRHFSRWKIVLLALVVLGVCHPVILRLLTWPLVADDAAAECDCYCIHGAELGAEGFEPFDNAAQWYREQPGRKILVLLPHETRIVEIGAVPSFEETCRKELGKRGIASAAIQPVPADALDVWDEARGISIWMKAHPESTLRIACGPFGGTRLRYVLGRVLAPAEASRVHVASLADPSYSAQNWWRSRWGVKEFMYAWLELGYAWTSSGNPQPRPAGARAFQEEIRARIGEAPP